MPPAVNADIIHARMENMINAASDIRVIIRSFLAVFADILGRIPIEGASALPQKLARIL